MHQKKGSLPKIAGITIFTVVMSIMAAVIVFYSNPLADPKEELLKKTIACMIILASIILFGLFYDKITVLPMELFQSRHLIWKLAKNDFKKRYAGSYLGALWAMVQPVVTIAMYYIVFEVIMTGTRPMAGNNVPYVLFLTTGLVPWFYFTESLQNGSNAMLEYTYLVKKVVFKISIIPLIKLIGASFIHLFFMGVMLIVAAFYGYYPGLHTIQLLYYSGCLFVFVLAICYTTCAVMVFFRDLAQIINILLQIGMWATPILWDIETLSKKTQMLIKINPLVYIVNGYRSTVIEQKWFFEDFYSTVYFWIITVVIFGIGAVCFKRLKVHFADVL